jgi:hypothetical protein
MGKARGVRHPVGIRGGKLFIDGVDTELALPWHRRLEHLSLQPGGLLQINFGDDGRRSAVELVRVTFAKISGVFVNPHSSTSVTVG